MRAMVEPILSLVILAVEDRMLSVTFYREAFGWSLAVDTPTYAELALPNGMRLGIYDTRLGRRGCLLLGSRWKCHRTRPGPIVIVQRYQTV